MFLIVLRRNYSKEVSMCSANRDKFAKGLLLVVLLGSLMLGNLGNIFPVSAETEEVTVTFDAAGGLFNVGFESESDTYTETIFKDSTIWPLTPEREGFILSGWESDGESFAPNEDIIASATRTYTAQWEQGILINFDAGEGEFWDGSKTFSYYRRKGENIYVPDEPALSGKVFVAWSDGIGTHKSYKLSDMLISEPMSFTAVWADEISVTWNANGGLFSDGSTKVITTAAKGSLPANAPWPTREGYRWIGWGFADGPNKGKDCMYTPMSSDTNIDALWIEQITISLDMGPAVSRIDISLDKNTSWAEAPGNYFGDIFKDGNKFVVGYLTPAGTKYNGEKLTADTTLTAIWQEGIALTFDANGGTPVDPNSPLTRLANPNSPALLPSVDQLFKKEGYVGTHWAFADGRVVNYDIITEDTTLYAQYTLPITVTIDGNGGKLLDFEDGVLKDRIVKKEYPPNHSAPSDFDAQREGYLYGGLMTPDGRLYRSEKIGSDITLKALWGETITVSFDMGPEFTRSSEHIAKGSIWVDKDISMYQLVSADGKKISYYTLPDGTRYNGQQLSEDTKLTAVWTKVIFVKFDAGEGRWLDPQIALNTTFAVAAGSYVEDGFGDDFTMMLQKDGELWAGWKYADGAPYMNEPLMEDTVLYARYGEPVEITFDYGGGLALQAKTMRFGKGHVGKIEAPLRGTDRFMGYRKPDGTYYPASQRTIEFDESMTLTAVWNEITETIEGDIAIKFNPIADGDQASQLQANLQDSNFDTPLDQISMYVDSVPDYDPVSEFGEPLPDSPEGMEVGVESEVYDVSFRNLQSEDLQPLPGQLVEFSAPLGNLVPETVEVLHVTPEGEVPVAAEVIGSNIYIKGDSFSYYIIRGAILKSNPTDSGTTPGDIEDDVIPVTGESMGRGVTIGLYLLLLLLVALLTDAKLRVTLFDRK